MAKHREERGSKIKVIHLLPPSKQEIGIKMKRQRSSKKKVGDEKMKNMKLGDKLKTEQKAGEEGKKLMQNKKGKVVAKQVKVKNAKNVVSGMKENPKETKNTKLVKCKAEGCERIFVRQGNINIHMRKSQ